MRDNWYAVLAHYEDKHSFEHAVYSAANKDRLVFFVALKIKHR